ncbi:MAG TPA: hypothetical protein PKC21_07795 [Oligoflexia bacterium]|nr:hypothetical protein [Oligoflexia bacterium]HMR25240.1 hypothetical protein [Oligoflexia bacterium]
MKKLTFKPFIILLLLGLFLSGCDQIKDLFAKKPTLSEAESVAIVIPKFIQQFSKSKDEPGTQVALIIDPHEHGTPFFEIVSFNQDPIFNQNIVTAYDVLQKAHIDRQYHPGYKEPQVLILSLNNITRKKINGKAHDWAFFYLDNNQWKLSPEGVGTYKLKDGDVIGFSYSSWQKIDGEFKPEKTPLNLNK